MSAPHDAAAQLAQRIRAAREKQGFSMAQAAERANVAKSTLQGWERLGTVPAAQLGALARALGCDPAALLLGDAQSLQADPVCAYCADLLSVVWPDGSGEVRVSHDSGFPCAESRNLSPIDFLRLCFSSSSAK